VHRGEGAPGALCGGKTRTPRPQRNLDKMTGSNSLSIGVYFTFFLTKISEIYKGSPYTGGACPPKQGHEPVPIN
jgi:hypothetical protein